MIDKGQRGGKRGTWKENKKHKIILKINRNRDKTREERE